MDSSLYVENAVPIVDEDSIVALFGYPTFVRTRGPSRLAGTVVGARRDQSAGWVPVLGPEHAGVRDRPFFFTTADGIAHLLWHSKRPKQSLSEVDTVFHSAWQDSTWSSPDTVLIAPGLLWGHGTTALASVGDYLTLGVISMEAGQTLGVHVIAVPQHPTSRSRPQSWESTRLSVPLSSYVSLFSTSHGTPGVVTLSLPGTEGSGEAWAYYTTFNPDSRTWSPMLPIGETTQGETAYDLHVLTSPRGTVFVAWVSGHAGVAGQTLVGYLKEPLENTWRQVLKIPTVAGIVGVASGATDKGVFHLVLRSGGTDPLVHISVNGVDARLDTIPGAVAKSQPSLTVLRTGSLLLMWGTTKDARDNRAPFLMMSRYNPCR